MEYNKNLSLIKNDYFSRCVLSRDGRERRRKEGLRRKWKVVEMPQPRIMPPGCLCFTARPEGREVGSEGEPVTILFGESRKPKFFLGNFPRHPSPFSLKLLNFPNKSFVSARKHFVLTNFHLLFSLEWCLPSCTGLERPEADDHAGRSRAEPRPTYRENENTGTER